MSAGKARNADAAVVSVGAGASGLAAAQALRSCHLSCTVLDRLKEIFSNPLANHVWAATVTCWFGGQWTRGGYSAARPGQAHRRRVPGASLDQGAHFAGKATSQNAFATVLGRWLSGHDTTRRVALQLGFAR